MPEVGNICNMDTSRSVGVGRDWESVMIVYSGRKSASLSVFDEEIGNSSRYDRSVRH